MDNYDIKKERRDLYAPRRGRFDVIDVPGMPFLMVDGHGDPNTSPDYATALQTLYPLSYAVRAVAKKDLGRVHTVGPLEGLWWADDMETFVTRDKSAWDWTLMIVQPEWISAEIVAQAREQVAVKKPEVDLGRVRLETFVEGLAMQTLHVGSYDEEGPTLARMHTEEIPAAGLRMRGKHHEIYLSDARKTAPARLRTILRQPVERT